jgi:hypothetical protein
VWGSGESHLVSLPQGFPYPDAPWDWATSILERAEAGDYELEIMADSLDGDSDDDAAYINQIQGSGMRFEADVAVKVRDAMVDGLRGGAAIHARIINTEKYAPGLEAFFEQSFQDELVTLSPFGYKRNCNLWVSGSGHRVLPHVDPVDGLLCQLTGKKQVTVWSLPRQFTEAPLVQFSLNGRPDLYSGAESIEVELTPGKALHLPAGAAHAVYVPEQEQSVSLSFATFCAYPVVDVVAELNMLAETPDAYTLPATAQLTDAFGCVYLNPSVFRSHRVSEDMPVVLKVGLTALVLPSSSGHERALPGLLDGWWRYARETRSFPRTPSRGHRPPRV